MNKGLPDSLKVIPKVGDFVVTDIFVFNGVRQESCGTVLETGCKTMMYGHSIRVDFGNGCVIAINPDQIIR